MTGWKTKTMKQVFPTVIATIGLLIFATNGLAENKVDKDVAYGTHQRHVLDVYWNTDYKDAPIVFTIHGGGKKEHPFTPAYRAAVIGHTGRGRCWI